MPRARLPAIEDRLVLPVVVRAPERERVLSPDQACREIETRGLERLAEEHPAGVGVGDVDRRAGTRRFEHCCKRTVDDLLKLLDGERVVEEHQSIGPPMPLAGLAGVYNPYRDVVGRVRPGAVRELAPQDRLEVSRRGSVAAYHAMLPEVPDVAATRCWNRWKFGHRGLPNPRGVEFEVPHLGRCESRELEIAAVVLNASHLGREHGLVPFALEREPVVCEAVLTLLRI